MLVQIKSVKYKVHRASPRVVSKISSYCQRFINAGKDLTDVIHKEETIFNLIRLQTLHNYS